MRRAAPCREASGSNDLFSLTPGYSPASPSNALGFLRVFPAFICCTDSSNSAARSRLDSYARN
jgi:hypothetical protein